MRHGILAAIVVAATFLLSASPVAQQAPTLIVSITVDQKPAAGVEVRAGELRARTGADGEATFDLPPGTYEIAVTTAKHVPASATATVAVAAPAPTRVEIELEPLPEIEEEILVSATRSETRLKDQALRVEVIDREEYRGKSADDARKRGNAPRRDQRAARANDGAVARRGERAHPGPARTVCAPYRPEGKRYWLLGLLGERRWKSARFFINAENLFDVRQTRDDPLILQSRLPDGRWTVDAWGPLDGRVVNGGVRIAF